MRDSDDDDDDDENGATQAQTDHIRNPHNNDEPVRRGKDGQASAGPTGEGTRRRGRSISSKLLAWQVTTLHIIIIITDGSRGKAKAKSRGNQIGSSQNISMCPETGCHPNLSPEP